MKKNGFTLAEVLITLGIIGVVSAITIPSLMSNYKAHKLRTQFLKSYSVAKQAFKMMYADEITLDPESYGEDVQNKFYKVMMPYFQGTIDCGYSAGENKKMLPCYYWSTEKDFYKSLDGKTNIIRNYFDDGQFALQDGALFLFENAMNTHRLWLSIDINGFNNPPNRWGYDLFTFDFQDDGLIPMGNQKTIYNNKDLYCNINKSSEMNGIGCTQEALNNPDYFKEIVRKFK